MFTNFIFRKIFAVHSVEKAQNALLCFHCNKGYANAPYCYLIRTLPVLQALLWNYLKWMWFAVYPCSCLRQKTLWKYFDTCLLEISQLRFLLPNNSLLPSLEGKMTSPYLLHDGNLKWRVLRFRVNNNIFLLGRNTFGWTNRGKTQCFLSAMWRQTKRFYFKKIYPELNISHQKDISKVMWHSKQIRCQCRGIHTSHNPRHKPV
jgi:hypothetical protein